MLLLIRSLGLFHLSPHLKMFVNVVAGWYFSTILIPLEDTANLVKVKGGKAILFSSWRTTVYPNRVWIIQIIQFGKILPGTEYQLNNQVVLLENKLIFMNIFIPVKINKMSWTLFDIKIYKYLTVLHKKKHLTKWTGPWRMLKIIY